MGSEARTALAVVCLDTARFLPVMLEQARGLCDGIIVCLPYMSWTGQIVPLPVEREVSRIVSSTPGAALFRPSVRWPSSSPGRAEVMCRNLVLERADEDGYDYVTLLDGDEVLLSGEFGRVRDEVLSQGIDAAYCRCHEYWKWPDVRMLSPVEYVPVMQRCGLRYTRRTVYSVRTDRSRRVIYDQDDSVEILDCAAVHRLTWVRDSITDTLRMWRYADSYTRTQLREFARAWRDAERPSFSDRDLEVAVPGGTCPAVRIRGSVLNKIIK